MAAIAGSVIAGGSLGVDVLKSVLQSLGDINRKIAIGVWNKTDHPWEPISVYFSSGTSETNLPHDVPQDKALVWAARKTAGPVARGAVGVFTYYINGLNMTLAIMYSVPFDYNLYSNWWNIKLYSGRQEATKEMFKEMYDSNPFKGDNGWHTRDLGSGLQVNGAMASPGQTHLEIKVGNA